MHFHLNLELVYENLPTIFEILNDIMLNFPITSTTHTPQNPFQNSGGDGIFLSARGSESMCIFPLEVTEKASPELLSTL